jgi:predicted DsbA family dithiol-disulfide isomerase
MQGYFFAVEQGVDIVEFHNRMYRAVLKDGVNIEDSESLADYFIGLLDPALFRDVLLGGKYKQAALDANDYAYEKSDVWYVPAYRMEGRKLDSVGNVGVTKAQLAEFLCLPLQS